MNETGSLEATTPDGEAVPIWLARAVAVLTDVAATERNPAVAPDRDDTVARRCDDGAFVYPH